MREKKEKKSYVISLKFSPKSYFRKIYILKLLIFRF
jgi:hypothetical protein